MKFDTADNNKNIELHAKCFIHKIKHVAPMSSQNPSIFETVGQHEANHYISKMWDSCNWCILNEIVVNLNLSYRIMFQYHARLYNFNLAFGVDFRACLDIEMGDCCQHFIQWQRSFHLKAVLPLDEMLATASHYFVGQGPVSQTSNIIAVSVYVCLCNNIFFKQLKTPLQNYNYEILGSTVKPNG